MLFATNFSYFRDNIAPAPRNKVWFFMLLSLFFPENKFFGIHSAGNLVSPKAMKKTKMPAPSRNATLVSQAFQLLVEIGYLPENLEA